MIILSDGLATSNILKYYWDNQLNGVYIYDKPIGKTYLKINVRELFDTCGCFSLEYPLYDNNPLEQINKQFNQYRKLKQEIDQLNIYIDTIEKLNSNVGGEECSWVLRVKQSIQYKYKANAYFTGNKTYDSEIIKMNKDDQLFTKIKEYFQKTLQDKLSNYNQLTNIDIYLNFEKPNPNPYDARFILFHKQLNTIYMDGIGKKMRLKQMPYVIFNDALSVLDKPTNKLVGGHNLCYANALLQCLIANKYTLNLLNDAFKYRIDYVNLKLKNIFTLIDKWDKLAEFVFHIGEFEMSDEILNIYLDVIDPRHCIQIETHITRECGNKTTSKYYPKFLTFDILTNQSIRMSDIWCENCKKTENGHKYYSIANTPDFIIIWSNVLEYCVTLQNITTIFKVPEPTEQFTTAQKTSIEYQLGTTLEINTCKYEIYGMVYNIRNTHFISHVKYGTQWYYCNDNSILNNGTDSIPSKYKADAPVNDIQHNRANNIRTLRTILYFYKKIN
jgi:hypothetical protein